MSLWHHEDDHPDDLMRESPEERAERVEDTLALALMGRDPLVLAWSTSTEAQCRRNRRRYAVARVRAVAVVWPLEQWQPPAGEAE